MYRNTFGTKSQISFVAEADYYELLGYLAKEDGTTKLVWEHNDEQGAWAEEGRIQSYEAWPTTLNANVKHTAGAGNIVSRINCNEFVKHIAQHHHFVPNGVQDVAIIKASIPAAYASAFDRGLAL